MNGILSIIFAAVILGGIKELLEKWPPGKGFLDNASRWAREARYGRLAAETDQVGPEHWNQD